MTSSERPEKTPRVGPSRKLAAGPRRAWAPIVAFLLVAAVGGTGVAVLPFLGGVGCSGERDGDAGDSAGERVSAVDAVSSLGSASQGGEADGPPAATSGMPTASGGSASALPAPDAPYDGPYLGAMAFQTPIYPETRFSDERLGYIRQGGKVPVDATPIKKANCKQGWFKLVDGGYVCGKYATLDLGHARVKLGVRQPDLASVVPYQYAYNRFHGTPLYKALPTREEMLRYEPYLADKDKKSSDSKKGDTAESTQPAGKKSDAALSADPKRAEGEERPKAKHAAPAEGSDGNVPSSDTSDARAAVAAVTELDTGAREPDEPPPVEPPKSWWQSDEKNPAVSLSDLGKDADGNLDKRMVKGFYVAVDKTFGWNDRLWYRTTSGLVAPTDRMWVNKPPESKGIDWPEGAKEIFFVLGDKAVQYELGDDKTKMKDAGKLTKLSSLPLTGKTLELDGTLYRETTESRWVKASAGTVAAPARRPSDVGDSERWVDVDLEKKTLVLLIGDKPVYAALVSPGKRSRNKKKNHATPTGAWRIREKHVATTMDGDGASGDLPYSIEDVPYVAYFKGSYALHAAFWHSSFGREMSHGCVNLSPKDAKHVFDFVEPRVPRGWHGVFASKQRPGSMVVVHE